MHALKCNILATNCASLTCLIGVQGHIFPALQEASPTVTPQLLPPRPAAERPFANKPSSCKANPSPNRMNKPDTKKKKIEKKKSPVPLG